MIRILVVEDDRDISALIQLALKNAGYDVFAAFDGQEGANLLETQKFELCLLDIMLPQISGYELFSYINEYSIPVIFITARGELDDKRKAFRMGADDYIVKPFEIEELLLRTENILRLHGYKNNLLRVGDVELDAEAHIVRKAGREITLTPKEFELLHFLLRNKGVALSRFALYERVWNDGESGDTRTLDIHITRLRKNSDSKMRLQRYISLDTSFGRKHESFKKSYYNNNSCCIRRFFGGRNGSACNQQQSGSCGIRCTEFKAKANELLCT